MEYHNPTAEILTAITPMVVALIALIQARMARAKSKENGAKIEKVENALYDSPAVDGPYKDRRTAQQTADTVSEQRRKTDK